MPDTPGPLKSLRARTFGTVFKLGPEGEVQMTWQTLVVAIAFIVSATWWAADVYSKVARIPDIAAEQRAHREALIKGGLLSTAKLSE